MYNQTILVVDDSRVSRMMISAFIKQINPNAKVHEAGDGEEALSIVDAHELDLIIMDYNMPGDNGLVVSEKILNKTPDAVIALLTANIQDAIQTRAKEKGIEFVGKPITEDKIGSILKLIS